MKKTALSFVLGTTLVLGGVATSLNSEVSAAKLDEEIPKDEVFKDLKVDGNESVYNLKNKDIINGYDNNTFKPYNNVSRQHVAVMLVKAMELDLVDQLDEVLESYSDVDLKHIYANEIATVIDEGVFVGNNGKFNPGKNITRGQMATVLVKAFDLQANDQEVALVDLQDINESHRDNVKVLAQNNITIGQKDGKGNRVFNANDSITRVQFSNLLDRTMKSVDGSLDDNVSDGSNEGNNEDEEINDGSDNKDEGITVETVTEEEVEPFVTNYPDSVNPKYDPEKNPDVYERVDIEGVDGIKEVTYEVTYKNGKEVDRVQIESKVIQEMVPEEISYDIKDDTPEEYNEKLQKLINDYRAENGVGPVEVHMGMAEMAERHAQVMWDEGGIRHRTEEERQRDLKEAGITGTVHVGENVASGVGAKPSSAFNIWKGSSLGHNELMLKADLKYMGAGTAEGNAVVQFVY